MAGWVTKSRLYLLSTVMKHGTEDWKLISDVINTHLSGPSVQSEVTGVACEEEYERLVAEESETPVSSKDPPLHARLVEELRKLRIEEIDAELSVCKLRYFSVNEDRQVIESGRLREHYSDICNEIDKKGDGFNLRNYCDERGAKMYGIEKEVKSGQKSKSKSKSNKNAPGTTLLS